MPTSAGGHGSPAYKQAVAEGENISPRTVFERDTWVCRLCDTAIDPTLVWPAPASASVDHIVPISLGGPHVYDNVQAAHLRCNSRKGGRNRAA